MKTLAFAAALGSALTFGAPAVQANDSGFSFVLQVGSDTGWGNKRGYRDRGYQDRQYGKDRYNNNAGSYGYKQGASLRSVRRALSRRGYRSMELIRRTRQGDFVVEAYDRYGRHARLRMHAVTAEPIMVNYLDVYSHRKGYGRNKGYNVPIHRVQRRLNRDGYSYLTLVSQGRDRYVFHATNRSREDIELTVIASTGDLKKIYIRSRDNYGRYSRSNYVDPRPRLQWNLIAGQLVQQNYRTYGNPVNKTDYWQVNAYDNNKRRVELQVCPFTGQVLESEYL